MPRITQDIQDIKHLVLLRKALAGRHSLEIYSRNPSLRLTIGEGVFHGGDCVETLCTMIEEPVPVFDWEHLERKARFIACNPKEIFVRAMARMRPGRERLLAYPRIFSALPRVRIRLNPIFRSDKSMQEEYQSLYRLSLTGEGASISDFLMASSGDEQLRCRTGIVIAGYCLGDFVAVAKAGEKGGGKSVVAKILKHFRRRKQG